MVVAEYKPALFPGPIRQPGLPSQDQKGVVQVLTWNSGTLTETISKKKGVNNDAILTEPAAPTGN